MRVVVLTVALLGALAPAAARQPAAGAPLDPDLFAFHRTIPDGRPGAVALVLDAFALAHSRGPNEHFADVRVLDASHRQVPYVIEHREEPLTMPLAAERADPPAGASAVGGRSSWSHYRLRLPCANLPASELAIETSARVFQRGVQLSIARPADRHSRNARLDIIAATTWANVAEGEPAPALVLAVATSDASELWLSIDEGDNSALAITGVRLLLPSYRLRFYRPARSTLQLVYGRSDLLAPRYDLALLSQEVLSAEAPEVTALGEKQSDRTQRRLVTPLGFWIFLSVAVLVLLALIVRLARRQSELP